MLLEEIEIGDRVLITRKARSAERGWNNHWVDSMDKYVGETHTVAAKPDECGVITEESSGFYFPWFVLRRIGI